MNPSLDSLEFETDTTKSEESIDVLSIHRNISRGLYYNLLPIIRIPLIANEETSSNLEFLDVETLPSQSEELLLENLEDNLNSHEKIRGFLTTDAFQERADLKDNISPRTEEFMKDIEDDIDEDQVNISFDSFRNFINFLVDHREVSIPSFVITPEGNIRVLWKKSSRQYLAVEFHPDKRVTYVIFAPDVSHPTKPMRSSGTIINEILCDVVEPYGAFKWILNQ